jgi:hypothetical protein
MYAAAPPGFFVHPLFGGTIQFRTVHDESSSCILMVVTGTIHASGVSPTGHQNLNEESIAYGRKLR